MFKPHLAKLGSLLDRYEIPYMVIGGQAVLLYAEPRMTKDIDVTLGVDQGRLEDVLRLVREAGWKVRPENPTDFVARTMVLPCVDPGSGILFDLVFSFSPYERQALERVRKVEMDGIGVRFCSPEDLVIHKLVAGRPRDLEDARMVILKNQTLDMAYVRKWLVEFENALSVPLRERLDGLTQ